MIGKEITNQGAVCLVVADTVAGIEMVGDNTGDNEVEWSEKFEATREEYPFLAFGQTTGSEGALNDLLVGAPVEKIE